MQTVRTDSAPLRALILFSAVCCWSPAFATEYLPEIVIVSERVDTDDKSTSAWVNSAEDIRAWNALNVSEALDQVPGLNVQYGAGSGEARAWIRGFRDRDALVLYDGIPIASANDGTLDLAEISATAIDAIRVLKSAPSVIYGPNGLAGVIDMVPREPAGDFAADVALQWGEAGARSVDATVSGGTGRLLHSVSLAHTRADSYPVPDSREVGGERSNADYSRSQLLWRTTLSDTQLGDTSLFVLRTTNDKGLPPQLGVAEPDYERLTDSDRAVYALSHRFAQVPVSVKIFRSEYDYTLKGYDSANYDTVTDFEQGSAETQGLRAFARNTLGELTLTSSVSYTEEQFTSAEIAEAGERWSLDYINLAAALDGELTDNIAYSLGGIFTRYQQAQAAEELTAFNPQLALNVTASDRLNLRVSAAQRTRFPKLVELYGAKYGNPDLHEAESNNIDLQVQYALSSDWQLAAGVYYYDVKGLIEKPARRSPYANTADAVIKGVEFTLSGALSETAALTLSASDNSAEERLEEGGSRQLRSRPERSVFTDLRWTLTDALSASVRTAWFGGLHDIDDDGIYREVDNAWVSSASIEYAVSERTAVTLTLNNLTDAAYEHKIGYPRAGRSAMLGARFAF